MVSTPLAEVEQIAPTDEEVLEEVKGLGSNEMEFLKNAAKNDLYVLCKGILRYKDVNPATHGAFCRFIQSHESRRRLALMPRGHLKSTIATIGDSLRVGLADPDDARVLIVGETATTSEKFLAEVKGHIEKNQLIRTLFPELIPPRFSGPGSSWSGGMASLHRQSAHKEPTWQAIGVGGAVVGGHFTRIKCDDLIGFEASRSPAKMQEAIAWVNNIESLLVDQHVDIIDWIGTRWSLIDLYAHIMEGYGSELAVFSREAIENGEIIFPQKHTWAEYSRIQRISPAVWFAQYCNNPIAGGQSDLPIESVRSFRFNHDATAVVFLDDTGREKSWQIRQLDRILCADPNSGSKTAEDHAAIVAVGVSPDDEVFSLEAWSDRVSPSDFVDRIYSMARRWTVRVVGIEKAGQQNTQHYFEKKAKTADYFVRVEPLLHGNRNKDDRIVKSLEPVIRSGRLYLLPSQSVLRGQIAAFPATELKDQIDALAYHVQLARTPALQQKSVERHGDILDLVLARRNRRTGY